MNESFVAKTAKATQKSPTVTRPSSPRHFFARLYGHLEPSKDPTKNIFDLKDDKGCETKTELCKPQPVTQSSLPFSLFSGSISGALPIVLPREDGIRLALGTTDAHFAGFSAFCKLFFL